jgi:magnesium transporter
MGMATTRKIGSFVWHDLVGASAENQALLRELGLSARETEGLLASAIHPKSEAHPGHLFTVVHGLDLDYAHVDDEFELTTIELDAVIGEGWLVTHADQPLEVIRTVAEQVTEDPSSVSSPCELLYRVLDTIVDEYDPFLEVFLPQRIDAIEDELFNDRLSTAVRREIYLRRRDVIQLQRIAVPQAKAMRELVELAKDCSFARDEAPLFHHVANRLDRVASLTFSLRSELDSAFEHYLSAVANTQNEVMKVLTMVSAILLPMTVIAGVYGMNFTHIPELRQPWGYPLALVLMAFVGFLGWLYFRARGWIGRGPARLPDITEIPVLGQVLRLPSLGARAITRRVGSPTALARDRSDRYDRPERRGNGTNSPSDL